MNPEFEDEKAVNPFDMWEGANFKMKIRNLEGFRNYDKSEFDESSPVEGEDDALEKLWSSEHSLVDFLDPRFFKSYAELQTKLQRILGTTAVATTAEEVADVAPEPTIKQQDEHSKPKSESADNSLEFFKQLAEEG